MSLLYHITTFLLLYPLSQYTGASRLNAHELFKLPIGSPQAPGGLTQLFGNGRRTWVWWLSVGYTSTVVLLVIVIVIIHCVTAERRPNRVGDNIRERIRRGDLSEEEKVKLYQLYLETKQELIREAEKSRTARKSAYDKVIQRHFEKHMKSQKMSRLRQRLENRDFDLDMEIEERRSLPEETTPEVRIDTTPEARIDTSSSGKKADTKLKTSRANAVPEKGGSEQGDQKATAREASEEINIDTLAVVDYYEQRSKRQILGEIKSPARSSDEAVPGSKHTKRGLPTHNRKEDPIVRLRSLGRDSQGEVLPPIAGPGDVDDQ